MKELKMDPAIIFGTTIEPADGILIVKLYSKRKVMTIGCVYNHQVKYKIQLILIFEIGDIIQVLEELKLFRIWCNKIIGCLERMECQWGSGYDYSASRIAMTFLHEPLAIFIIKDIGIYDKLCIPFFLLTVHRSVSIVLNQY